MPAGYAEDSDLSYSGITYGRSPEGRCRRPHYFPSREIPQNKELPMTSLEKWPLRTRIGK